MTLTHAARHTGAVGDKFDRLEHRLPRWAGPIAVVFAALAVMLINPIGFSGGGNDDAYYVEAARCWVAGHGACLPANHWASRWPLVAPIALLTGLFGESRATVGLAPLGFWAASIMLLAWLGRLWFDRATGLVAGFMLAALPVFTASALQPWIDSTELCFQLAALVAATYALRRQSVVLAIGAGMLAGLAFASRETSILFVGVAALAWFRVDRGRRVILLWAVPGLVAVVALEMAVYLAATGDPLTRFNLALNHVEIPSEELPKGFDTSHSPLLNPAYIAAWRREAGIHLWWPVDPWLNLIASPRFGWLATCAALLLVTCRATLREAWRRSALQIVGAALLVAVLLVYALAVDPKPRMFLLLGCALALGGAALAMSGWRAGRKALVGSLLLALWGVGLAIETRMLSFRPAESPAAAWLTSYPGQIESDSATRSLLMLVPGIDDVALPGSGRPLRIATAIDGCAELAWQSGTTPVRLLDRASRGIVKPAELCLFAYR
ncbi:MAG: glycosyltransferase family 39 protein [Sphingomonas bacterium]|nr:glycosyltransferase family 39 protein [Sphingomonas bacterium]